MAKNLDFQIPFNDLRQYVPKELRNTVISGLIDNLFNRFMTHDEAVPMFGYVGRKPSSTDDRSPAIPQPTVERDVNAVIPVLNFKNGSEDVAFTVADIIKHAENLGISPGTQNWLYSQGNNFHPPINFDKFTNFFNYHWIGNAIEATPDMEWNPEKLAEYYVIAKPAPSDLDKINVRVSNVAGQQYVLTGSGFLDQSFTLTFTSATTFTIAPAASLIGPLGMYSQVAGEAATYALPVLTTGWATPGTEDIRSFTYTVTGPAGTFQLLEFKISREATFNTSSVHTGWTEFDVGDVEVIDTTFLSATYSLGFTGSTGVKPKVFGVRALKDYLSIDGIQLRNGDRVLIQGQAVDSTGSFIDGGIFTVGPQGWSRAADFTTGTWAAGSKVYVVHGSVNGGKLFQSAGTAGAWTWSVIDTESNTSDWQEANLWLSSAEIDALGIDRTKITQAQRPIIEFDAGLQLNGRVVNGKPEDWQVGGHNYYQHKTEFNELPLFDLFRYDGTHSGLVSSIFYYMEDLTADVDLVLQRRVKISTNGSGDFLFNHGCVDGAGQLLFFRTNGEIKTVWHAGYNESTIVDASFVGDGNGLLTGLTASATTQQQVWLITAVSATEFTVAGSKMVTTPNATVGTPYTNGEIAFTISAGSTPFSIGDVFTVRVANLERPRYVYRTSDGNFADLYGGAAGDTNSIGAWQVPRTFVNNPYNENRAEIAEGSAYAHFRSVLANQIDGQTFDYAFGGSIKLWSEQQTLLASLLMQRDMTPISMIDLALRQYDSALNGIRDTYVTRIVDYFSSTKVPSTAADVNALVDLLIGLNASSQTVKTVLQDTTAGVAGFPATLPQLGIAPLVLPEIAFDPVLGYVVLVHHDGHRSTLQADNQTFRDELLGTYISDKVLRSDGSMTAAIGSFTNVPPVAPYKGELWMKPDGTIWAFAVDYDTVATPDASVVGSTWYERGTNTLYTSDGATWIAEPFPTAAWTQIDFADLLNTIMLVVEQRLYKAINPNQRKFDFSAIQYDQFYLQQLRRELFTFAAVNGYDPLGTDYSASNAFTWNYSQATVFAPVTTSTVPARWYNALMAHQLTVPGVIATERPNLEPWKLFGFSDYATWWASLSPATQVAYTPFATPADIGTGWVNGGQVKLVDTVSSAVFPSGLAAIDGYPVSTGDLVLLVNHANQAFNGVWVASAGSWTRAATSLTALTYFTVVEGSNYAGSVWTLVNSPAVVNTDPIYISQVRTWTTAMWNDVLTLHPALKLSVNPYTDELLPPYVSSALVVSQFALTTTIPAGIALPYQFGEGSPLEEAWSRSIEFGYAQAKALFRFDPLAFLGFCWGFNWVEVDGILYDGYDLSMPGHKRFMLHGEAVDATRQASLNVENITSTDATIYTITYDAYDDNRRQNFSVRDADGIIVGYIAEGVTTSFSTPILNITGTSPIIEDFGVPFHIGDTFSLTFSGSTFVQSFTPATYHKVLGFGQIFTNALRAVSIDTTSSYAASAFRGWEINMGYRASGIVATDDLKVLTDSDALNSNSYRLIFKKNEGASSLWLQGLRVTVLQYGSLAKKNGFDMPYPSNDGSDWTFRIEGYNPRFLDISYYTYPTTTSRVTFYALDKSATALAWTQPMNPNGVVNTQLPLTITGLQNVVDFLYGYVQYVTDKGWTINPAAGMNIDAETGRTRTWQLEIEKLVDRVYRGIQPGEGHIINPFIEQVQVQQATGLLGQFYDTVLFDVISHAAVYDVNGAKLKQSDIGILRTNEASTISATVPIFSVHALIDEYEHLFVFNDYINGSDASGLLYDPFTGARVVTYKFNGRKQGSYTMRPELGGHYLVGNQVRVNMQASTDAVANIYDANHVFENTLTSRHALALLGFNQKSYFEDLDITNRSQFNFWRGLIQSKGTNLSIDAYLNNDRFKEAKIDEYWAYKIAEYGDARQKTYPELRLQVADVLQQFTQLQFDADVGGELNNFTQITSFDETRWFSLDDLNQDTYFKAEVAGVFSKTVSAGEVVTLPFIADALSSSLGFTQLNATTIQATAGGNLVITGYGAATPRYNPVKLINYEASELTEEISFWHPAIGQHNPIAMEALNVISTLDPARYSYSTLVVNNNSYDPLRAWGDREVGRTWLDTRNLTYVPYYDSRIFPEMAERLSRWGALADFASVDVYEWVKSDVPPSEYDAKSKIDAGNADIDNSVKASGQVALVETYTRDRTWSVHPVAWSYSPLMLDVDWGDHPPMKYSGDITGGQIYFGAGQAILQSGTFADLGIVAGDKIGTWQHGTNPMPVSEGTINDAFFQSIDSGTGGDVNFSVQLVASSYPASDVRLIGDIAFVWRSEDVQLIDIDGLATDQWDTNFYVKVLDGFSRSEEILVKSVRGTGTTTTPPASATISVTAGDLLSFAFSEKGLTVKVTATTTGTFSVSDLCAAIVSITPCLKDGTTVQWLVAPDTGIFTNDSVDPEYALNGAIGWRAWTVPTQAQLDADGKYPVSSWKPYVGDAVLLNASSDELQTAVAYQANPLTLNDGTVVARYTTSWTDWSLLSNEVKTVTATAAGTIAFNATDFGAVKFDATRTSVYVNGLAQLKSTFTIDGATLTVNAVPAGTIVTVIVRKYEPSSAEIAFDPDVKDDLSFQRQFKKDYEYAKKTVRGTGGSPDTEVYYFWVRGKTTVATGKKLSVSVIAQNLRSGPSSFLTFQNLLAPVADKPWRYDAITVSGLSYKVTKDDAFKLRFTRNFTLRDDPQDLDLKDTHTEWGMMRPGQKTRIPEFLWNKLIDSASGTDGVGNAVPALRRVLYDERRGTTTQFGFGIEQTLAPLELLRSSLASMVVNTKLTEETPTGTVTNYIDLIDSVVNLRAVDSITNSVEKLAAQKVKVQQVLDAFFSTPEQVRSTLTAIWSQASYDQVNELFFAALDDILASNYELTDIFKTSRLSMYSIQERRPGNVVPTYD